MQITYLIDPDTRTFARHLKTIENDGGNTPKTVQDVRKALDDKDLDAVSIATPNHWHALMTIWACQAGKDVYVEKPCSHNVHEGRIAVEIARKHNRIVQHGTQSRSSGELGAGRGRPSAVGKLGKLLVSRGLCYKARGTHRRSKPTTSPPAELDFNLWLGPAAEQPYHENLVHYNWHWFWDFGNGDIGNQGVHQMDIARWVIPGATLPKSVISLGGRFGYNDQGETPNTQIAIIDYGETQLIFEVRGLKTDKYHGRGRRQHLPPRGGRHRRQQVLSQGRDESRAAAQGRRSSAAPAAATTSATSSPPSAAARSRTSTPTSSKATTPAPCATWPTSPTAWARRCRSTRRPRPSATTRRPTRRSARMEEHLQGQRAKLIDLELPPGPQAELRRQDRDVRRRRRGQPNADPRVPQAVRGAGEGVRRFQFECFRPCGRPSPRLEVSPAVVKGATSFPSVAAISR